MPRTGTVDAVMQRAETRQKHIARQERPHLAQEYEDRAAIDDAEDICFKLMPHPRMCAKGEVSPGFVRRAA